MGKYGRVIAVTSLVAKTQKALVFRHHFPISRCAPSLHWLPWVSGSMCAALSWPKAAATHHEAVCGSHHCTGWRGKISRHAARYDPQVRRTHRSSTSCRSAAQSSLGTVWRSTEFRGVCTSALSVGYSRFLKSVAFCISYRPASSHWIGFRTSIQFWIVIYDPFPTILTVPTFLRFLRKWAYIFYYRIIPAIFGST